VRGIGVGSRDGIGISCCVGRVGIGLRGRLGRLASWVLDIRAMMRDVVVDSNSEWRDDTVMAAVDIGCSVRNEPYGRR